VEKLEYQRVKVVGSNLETAGRQTVKEGVIVDETSIGARVWDPKDPADSPERAEWFPFNSSRLEIVPLKPLR